MELDHLNEAQKKAVIETDGPVMILAGAGSGKTRTLVTRILYLLNEKKISPYQILAVTFSNKAAKEMKERVSKESTIDLGALQITTFHALCAKILRSEAQYLGLSRNFTIYDQSESKSVIKTILGQRGLSQKEINPAEVQVYIDHLKNLGYYPGLQDEEILIEIDQTDLFFSLFQDYESELHRSNAVDFGGLICGVLQLFDHFPDVLKRYQERFKYLLVDEYQDTNRSQFKLIKLLSELNKNICVVGDEDQSIYSWRGADIRNILDYEKYFPNSKILKLEQNYRSSKNIIEAATFVISKNLMRKGKEMWTDNDKGEYIDIIECADDRSEADFVSREIKSHIDAGVSPEEIAVFYRTNAQSRMIEDALRHNNIHYRVVAGIKFYERKEIKDILSYVRIVVNPKDSLALSRIINVPVRGVGAVTLRKIEDEALRLNLSLWEMLERFIDKPLDYPNVKVSGKVLNSLSQFVNLIQEVQIHEIEKRNPSFTYQKLLVESGYLDFIKSEKTHEAKARVENLEELLTAIKQYEEYEKEPSLLGFLETITLDTETSQEDHKEEVSLMTIHGAKGLEYHYVFLCGVEESIFPSYLSFENGDQGIEEERRLFYVAMTRAMKKLYILFARGRMLWGSIKFNGPSRFIDEIPNEYYQWRNYKVDYYSHNDDVDEFNQELKTEKISTNNFYTKKIIINQKYKAGQKVRHKLYGVGLVLKAEGTGPNEKVTIQFPDGVKKNFMVQFAPLELIG